jgi:hypothetical protein
MFLSKINQIFFTSINFENNNCSSSCITSIENSILDINSNYTNNTCVGVGCSKGGVFSLINNDVNLH